VFGNEVVRIEGMGEELASGAALLDQYACPGLGRRESSQAVRKYPRRDRRIPTEPGEQRCEW
jgi:hypothetical protein